MAFKRSYFFIMYNVANHTNTALLHKTLIPSYPFQYSVLGSPQQHLKSRLQTTFVSEKKDRKQTSHRLQSITTEMVAQHKEAHLLIQQKKKRHDQQTETT